MDTITLVLILAISAALSAAYAEILRRHPHWYRYNGKTWVTVVIGAALIIGTLGVCAVYGLIGIEAIGLVILVSSAWGAPIIIWQLSQSSAETALYQARVRQDAQREVSHDKNTRR